MYLWILLVFFLLLPPVAIAQVTQVVQEELQIAVRRYMQCQADNVGIYNVQVQLSQSKLEKLQTELNAAKKEIEQLKAVKKEE